MNAAEPASKPEDAISETETDPDTGSYMNKEARKNLHLAMINRTNDNSKLMRTPGVASIKQ